MDYDNYQKACNKIREKSNEYLDLLGKPLTASGLRNSTVKRHMSNVNFYINEFPCSEIKDGMETWQAGCTMYNDLGAPNPFAILF